MINPPTFDSWEALHPGPRPRCHSGKALTLRNELKAGGKATLSSHSGFNPDKVNNRFDFLGGSGIVWVREA